MIALAPEHDGDLDRLVSIAGGGARASHRGGPARRADDEHDARAAAAALNRAALSQGIVLAELHLRRPTLESQYLATIEGDR